MALKQEGEEGEWSVQHHTKIKLQAQFNTVSLSFPLVVVEGVPSTTNMYHQHVPPTCTTTNMYHQHVPPPTCTYVVALEAGPPLSLAGFKFVRNATTFPRNTWRRRKEYEEGVGYECMVAVHGCRVVYSGVQWCTVVYSDSTDRLPLLPLPLPLPLLLPLPLPPLLPPLLLLPPLPLLLLLLLLQVLTNNVLAAAC